MYKKIMFLIITLSIIINVGNSTVVMAKENIVTEIVDKALMLYQYGVICFLSSYLLVFQRPLVSAIYG